MDTGAAKGIELILVILLVLGFYLQQTRALNRARDETKKTGPEQGEEPSKSQDG